MLTLEDVIVVAALIALAAIIAFLDPPSALAGEPLQRGVIP